MIRPLLLSLLLASPALAQESVHHVISIHDGDSIKTREDGPIRFSGIDAPEIGSRARCPREERLAEEARDYVALRLEGGVVLRRRLGERDVEKYGREGCGGCSHRTAGMWVRSWSAGVWRCLTMAGVGGWIGAG